MMQSVNPIAQVHVPLWLALATSLLAGYALGHLGKCTAPVTTVGRAKKRGEKAFVLAVELQFKDEETAAQLIKDWTKAADWCYVNEPFLYHYEANKSDKDPLKYVIYERYNSKEDYLGAHKSSAAFNEFRPKMKALQDSGAVVVSGNSYNELGVGFV